MPTSNIAVTTTWTKLADTTNDSVLVTWEPPVILEVATTATDTAPTVTGHRLNNEQAITRTALGTGYIWAKTVPGSFASSVLTVVTK